MKDIYRHPVSGAIYEIDIEGTTFVITKDGHTVHSGGEVIAITGQVLDENDALRIARSWVNHQDG